MTELGTVPPPAASESDEQALLQRLRNGEDAAFGELFERHAAAVRRLAQSLAADRSEAEDITAETFFRVLQALRRGAGPRDYVRAYLLTVARRVSWEWHGARRDVPVSDDELTFRAGAGADTHARTAEHTLITTAFTSLPERWRTVLWQTEVEGEQPAMVAPHFGLSANATAALARRARQGLRAAYLQAHLSVNRGPDSCRAVVEKLGGFTAGSVTGAEAERIKAHLLGCSSCRATQDELRDVCSSLRAHAGVLVLLVPAAASLGGSGVLAGLGATVKGVLVGSKVKIGLALASTAAVGAVGVAAGPVLFGSGPVQDIGLPGGAPELVVVPPSETHHQPPPQEPPEPRIGIGVLNGRGTGVAVPPRARSGEQQVAANEVPGLPVAGDVPVAAVGGGAGDRPAPREDLASSPFVASEHPASAPRLDSSRPAMTMTTESTDAPAPEDAGAPELSPTGGKPVPPSGRPTDQPKKPAPKDDETGATETPTDASPTDTSPTDASTTEPPATEPPATEPSTTEPSTTVTPTSEKPCPSSASSDTGSGEPADPAPAAPSGS
ncbi:RNA polymerase sigma factor domain-containing protein [Amycolatopsis mediterranei S699]|uniref:RNA polymerase sigma factor domain-containing protein n=3 Tax=Amycolatopsis mediterranei TaxID=33910 RepID=A0A0H3CTI3_AMYMU|nr:sigma-70 family RNA polymerase sigma factor [Amycolatopsis mediterranei]ADJ41952.1 RNA polymerase sigma factor domain-containing protein [Amycolatopsis mediterranei U32]AEK38625.1 RNA polymerase sigma factor domain-containing protein [Amycolatopsis mediterranei S699]AFO73662.1 RNA polymerase sigma factor domain-containing protein [Amycolatopsis mediterranei S699]AGT80791.1 RNA polymerase sigma factor domain-containing protein [Amycolatopsis mediterranei RB]KDO08784.1 RNA polymerase sigma fa